MAQEASANGFAREHTEIQCPYDKSHKLRPERYQRHLFLCRRNHPNSDIAICDFNNAHHIKESELEDHYRVIRSHSVSVVNVSSFWFFVGVQWPLRPPNVPKWSPQRGAGIWERFQ